MANPFNLGLNTNLNSPSLGSASLLPGVSTPKAKAPQTKPNLDKANNLFNGKLAYSVIPQNWFSAKPYGFKMTTKANPTTPFVMFLPINPSNLTITTGFATNVVTTLYGTVEEHSPVRYYDILIEGTTGMAPKFVDINQNTVINSGRTSFPIVQGLSGIAGGFFSKTLGLVDQITNKAHDLLNLTPKPTTGVYTDQTGYLAFHNLYRFLLKYKEDASGVIQSNNIKRKNSRSNKPNTIQRHQHPLTFFNYKDNNEYDVVVRSFSLKKSADNPILYNYSISLRGYNMRSVGDSNKLDQTDLTNRLHDLGLDGVKSSSLLGDIKTKANQVKGILGPLGGGINILGR